MTRWPGFYILQWKFHSMPACATTNLPRVDDVLASLQVSSHKCKVMYYTEVIGSEDFRYGCPRGPRGLGTRVCEAVGSNVLGAPCPAVVLCKCCWGGGAERGPGGQGWRGSLAGSVGSGQLEGHPHASSLPGLLQRFHDQPGVQPQRVLPAERRHHLVQPVALQLHDFQVVLQGLRPIRRGDRGDAVPPRTARCAPPPAATVCRLLSPSR